MRRQLVLLLLCAGLLGGLAMPAARAATLSCPTGISLNGVAPPSPTGNPGRARLDQMNHLLCVFAGVGFNVSLPRPQGGGCLPLTLNVAVSGGNGTWRFGTPGSQATLFPPVQSRPFDCLYGGPTFFFPYVAVWREVPAGQVCTLSGTEGGAFTCTPAGSPPGPLAGLPGAPAGQAADPLTLTAAGACPATLAAASIPTEAWSETSAAAGYYAPDSFLLTANDGRLVQTNVPLKTVQSAMGAAFERAIFTLARAPSSNVRLPVGSFTCNYEGPRFSKGGKLLEATLAIACNGNCTLR
jgi:hypothetical protein